MDDLRAEVSTLQDRIARMESLDRSEVQQRPRNGTDRQTVLLTARRRLGSGPNTARSASTSGRPVGPPLPAG
jgi:hypothetical protein